MVNSVEISGKSAGSHTNRRAVLSLNFLHSTRHTKSKRFNCHPEKLQVAKSFLVFSFDCFFDPFLSLFDCFCLGFIRSIICFEL